MNSTLMTWTFHDTTNQISNGDELVVVGGMASVTIEITGTTTNATCVFECQINEGGNFYPVSAINLSTSDIATQTTGKNEIWQIDLIGLCGFRVRISSILDGNISIVGTVKD